MLSPRRLSFARPRLRIPRAFCVASRHSRERNCGPYALLPVTIQEGARSFRRPRIIVDRFARRLFGYFDPDTHGWL